MPELKEKLNALNVGSLCGQKIGLEKESLRVNEDGNISSYAHPQALGAPLTHPYITTDYAEALLELITPPCATSAETLEFLASTETFVYQHLNNEKLWTTSMPCSLKGEDDIKIARYGDSNVGQMKTVYRRGLGHRYGKLMQVIAGVHFNFSFSKQLCQDLYQQSQSKISLQEFTSQSYMDMTRNIQRYGWLVIYLFGASPAICKSFIKGLPNGLSKFDQDSYFAPYATSLRMGDIGYTNSKEGKTGIHIGYNSLAEYLNSMRAAIAKTCPEYAQIGIKKNGLYQQLNSNILQIENEHYSTVRPKQVLNSMEKPVDALENRGIEYIELRSLDINPHCPTGLTIEQLHFLEVCMNFCWFKDSPKVTQAEAQELNLNQYRVAQRGREPGLSIQCFGETVKLADYAECLFKDLHLMAEKLDQDYQCSRYSEAVNQHEKMILNSSLTPSAQILEEMRDKKESFMEFSLRKSCQHRDYYLNLAMDPELFKKFTRLSQESLLRQRQLEADDKLSFDEFLAQYQGIKKSLYKHNKEENGYIMLA